jgi:protein-disulfide isomerase
MPRRAAVAVWLLLLLSLACGPTPPPASPPSRGSAAAPAAQPEAAGPGWLSGGPADDADALGPVPVTRADPARGSRSAPVTLVVFSDFECPFCQRLDGTLQELSRRYGPEQLRVVWKNFPLAFHKQARPSAEVAMSVFDLHGPDAFWRFHDAVFGAEERLSPEIVQAALQRAGASPDAVRRALEGGAAAQKVDADLTLAARLGVTGTPASFINGVLVSGAQPIDRFTAIIDAQLDEARALSAQGTPKEAIYAALARKNFTPPPPESEEQAPEDTTVHQVPVGDSPARGKSTALVTLVMFGDYQCPFCSRAAGTIEALSARYGDKLRVVWKDNPLPFHEHAEPAAELAHEARAQRGDAAFWRAHARLLAARGALDDATLRAIAAELELNVPAAQRAIAAHRHAAKIEADVDLSDDLDASSTPHFFINGRRLVGAQPIASFQAIIDDEIEKAEALLARGTPPAEIYAALQKDAVPPPGPEKVAVPPPGSKAAPGKGAADGKVVVQMFADFQCPYCTRAAATMDELIKAFPGSVRVVWRNLPLPMHEHAQPAAEAAMEAFAQRGAAGFWKMHDLLLSDPSAGNIDRAALERHAASLGLDRARFAAALDAGTHRAAVAADAKAAESAGIRGTPGFVINGYLVRGAQPLTKFKKIVRRALGEAKGPPPPQPGGSGGHLPPARR